MKVEKKKRDQQKRKMRDRKGMGWLRKRKKGFERRFRTNGLGTKLEEKLWAFKLLGLRYKAKTRK